MKNKTVYKGRKEINGHETVKKIHNRLQLGGIIVVSYQLCLLIYLHHFHLKGLMKGTLKTIVA